MTAKTISRRPLSATRHNANVMAKRGGSAYNPGGHRGRSGENGAGNHRKSEADKERSRVAQAEVDAANLEKDREARALAKYEKEKQEVVDRIMSAIRQSELYPFGSWTMRLRRHVWNKKPLKMKCLRCTNVFETMPRDIITTTAKDLCPVCTNKSRGKPRADARMKFEMKCDEQGLDLGSFTNMREACEVRHRRTGQVHTIWPQNIDRWGCVPKDDRLVRFVADEDDHVFVFRGEPPIVKHPFIAKLLAENPIEEPETPRKSAAAMADVIRKLTKAGDKVVNLSMNAQWKEEGTYKWGELPTDAALGTYFDKLREKW